MTRHRAALAMVLAGPAAAQDTFVDFRSVTPEIALRMAQAAMESCRDEGYQVGVTVVDRAGVPQVYLRDRFAGPHTEETSFRKAWTAISFRTPTGELAGNTRSGSDAAAIRDLSQVLALGGGLPVEAAGSLVAGIGVSGAPSPEADEICAQTGIEAVATELAF